MKTAYWIGIVSALAVLGSAAAFSQSLKAREQMAYEEKRLIESATETNRLCGSSIAIKFDWTGVKGEELSQYSAGDHCGSALHALQKVCTDSESAKKTVQEKIKNVTCGFGATREIALKDGTVNYKGKFDSWASGDSDFVYKSLMDQL